jgi:hypothetical protein
MGGTSIFLMPVYSYIRRFINSHKKIVAGREVIVSSSIPGGEFTNQRDVIPYIQVLAVTQINIISSSPVTPFKMIQIGRNGFIPMKMRTFLNHRYNHD